MLSILTIIVAIYILVTSYILYEQNQRISILSRAVTVIAVKDLFASDIEKFIKDSADTNGEDGKAGE